MNPLSMTGTGSTYLEAHLMDHTGPSSIGTTPLAAFHLFPQLPPEIRLKIYLFSLPTSPRLIPLTYNSPSFSPTVTRARRYLAGLTSPAAIPPALQVNRESRAIAQKHYKLSLRLASSLGNPLPNKVYFAAERWGGDVLYFGDREAWTTGLKQFINTCMVGDREELNKVQRLAVNTKLFIAGVGTANKGKEEVNLRQFWECVMKKFENVKAVAFVTRPEDALEACLSAENQDTANMDMCTPADDLGGASLTTEMRRWANKAAIPFGCIEMELESFQEEGFAAKLERVVRGLETRNGWTAPKWKVLLHGEPQSFWEDRIGLVETRKETRTDQIFRECMARRKQAVS